MSKTMPMFDDCLKHSESQIKKLFQRTVNPCPQNSTIEVMLNQFQKNKNTLGFQEWSIVNTT